MTTQNPKNNNLNFRISYNDKKLIEMAANYKGLKPNTYARQKLLEAAKQDIAETNHLNSLVLDPENWNKLVAIMDAPIKSNKNLKKAVEDFERMFRNRT